MPPNELSPQSVQTSQSAFRDERMLVSPCRVSQLMGSEGERREDQKRDVEDLYCRSRQGSDDEENQHPRDGDSKRSGSGAPRTDECAYKRKRKETRANDAGSQKRFDPRTVDRRRVVVTE